MQAGHGRLKRKPVEKFPHRGHAPNHHEQREEQKGRPRQQNLAKAHYLAGKLPLRFSGPFFNEFVASTNGRTPDQINASLLDKKIIGGLPLERYYPELKDTMLLCATEMSRRDKLDRVAEVFAK